MRHLEAPLDIRESVAKSLSRPISKRESDRDISHETPFPHPIFTVG